MLLFSKISLFDMGEYFKVKKLFLNIQQVHIYILKNQSVILDSLYKNREIFQ